MSGSIFTDVTIGAADFTVPETGLYDIVAIGAQGGRGGGPAPTGGFGVRVSGVFILSAGEVLNIDVGGQGGSGTPPGPGARGGGGGGGGGSFVVAPVGTPLVIAGGGGGAGDLGKPGDGQTSTAGQTGRGLAGHEDGGLGGTNGSGGGGSVAAGGGGFYTPGSFGASAGGGYSYPVLRGGAGGVRGGTGGFGGGGGGGNSAGGGGGGFSGGGGGNNNAGGGGGGSFLAPDALDPSFSVATNTSGEVTIIPVSVPAPAIPFVPEGLLLADIINDMAVFAGLGGDPGGFTTVQPGDSALANEGGMLASFGTASRPQDFTSAGHPQLMASHFAIDSHFATG